MKIIKILLIVLANFYLTLNSAQASTKLSIIHAVTELEVENSLLTLEIDDPQLRLKADVLVPWIRYSAHAVSTYYARFPVSKYRLQLISIEGDRVKSGHAYGGDFPLIEVYIGKQVTEETLKSDWVLVHEMIHLALAELPRKHHWLVEGLAVYIESVARVQAGQLKQGVVWKSFIRSMPKGLPKAGDLGLDFTPTWGRRYWGGALFCLLADIQIRQGSNNRFGLQDALRGILDAGYSMKKASDIEPLLKLGDKATEQNVLFKLYQQMKANPVSTDLPELWQSLGVSVLNGEVLYDEDASLANLRIKIFD